MRFLVVFYVIFVFFLSACSVAIDKEKVSIYQLRQFSETEIGNGEAVYIYSRCHICHDFYGSGKGDFEFLSESMQKKMPDFTTHERFWWVSRKAIKRKIRFGNSKESKMPTYDRLSDKQTDEVTTFILSFLVSAELVYEGKPKQGELCIGGAPMFIETDGIPIKELLITFELRNAKLF